MPAFLNKPAIKSSEANEAKKIDEVNSKEINPDPRQPEAQENQDNLALHNLLSDHEIESDCDVDDAKVAFKNMKNDLNDSVSTLTPASVEYAYAPMIQSANVENLEKLNCLNITFRCGNNYQHWEVANVVNQIKSDPQTTKLVKLSFQSCTYVTDFELAYIGAGIASKLGNVEYLNLSFWDSRRITIFGIQELIRHISGQGNTLKSLRLRIRSHWYLGNQSLKDLIKGLRASLVNLEELHIVLAANDWVTSSGVKAVKDDQKAIEGFGLGLKKYEVSDKWCWASLFKDSARKEMAKYVMEKFSEMGVKEGALVSNKMFVYCQNVWKSSIVSSKIVLVEANKSA